MQHPRSSIARFLAVGIGATVLALGYSTVSTAIDFGAPPPPAEGAAEPATPPGGTPPAVAAPPAEIDQALVLAGLEVFKEANCRGCHGWAANGEREGPNPGGPSLRETLLPIEAIRITVACGRPGTQMPYFWRDAYRRDSTECYGSTAAQLGDLVPPRANVRFTDEELDNLAYYLEHYVKGLGEITLAECEFFYGVGNTRCNVYR
jgi:mono/diheme cytochrome c family protein